MRRHGSRHGRGGGGGTSDHRQALTGDVCNLPVSAFLGDLDVALNGEPVRGREAGLRNAAVHGAVGLGRAPGQLASPGHLAALAAQARRGTIDPAVHPTLAQLPPGQAMRTLVAALLEADPELQADCEYLSRLDRSKPASLKQLADRVRASHGLPAAPPPAALAAGALEHELVASYDAVAGTAILAGPGTAEEKLAAEVDDPVSALLVSFAAAAGATDPAGGSLSYRAPARQARANLLLAQLGQAPVALGLVDVAGGLVEGAGGPAVRLTVPAAAVAAETAIVAWTGASGIPTARTHGTVGPVVEFVPSGLAFGAPAQLELPYSTRLLRWLARTEAEVTIGVAARGDAAWTTLPATAALGVAAAQVTHFSLYAVTVESPDDVRVRVDTWDTGLDDVAWYGPAGQPIWTSRDPGDVELVETFDGKYNAVLAPSIAEELGLSDPELLSGVYTVPGQESIFVTTWCKDDVEAFENKTPCGKIYEWREEKWHLLAGEGIDQAAPGAAALDARFGSLSAIAVGGDGRIYVAESLGDPLEVTQIWMLGSDEGRKLTPLTARIPGYTGDERGAASLLRLGGVSDLDIGTTAGGVEVLFVADPGNDRIWAINVDAEEAMASLGGVEVAYLDAIRLVGAPMDPPPAYHADPRAWCDPANADTSPDEGTYAFETRLSSPGGVTWAEGDLIISDTCKWRLLIAALADDKVPPGEADEPLLPVALFGGDPSGYLKDYIPLYKYNAKLVGKCFYDGAGRNLYCLMNCRTLPEPLVDVCLGRITIDDWDFDDYVACNSASCADGWCVPGCTFNCKPPCDCNDQDASVYPGHAEVCDGKDNDCDPDTKDGSLDSDGDGWGDSCDCAATDSTRYPGAPDLCNGDTMDDCWQHTPDGSGETWFGEACDVDNSCPGAVWTCQGGGGKLCDAPERKWCFPDDDGDGYGTWDNDRMFGVCGPDFDCGVGYVYDIMDCNDNDGSIWAHHYEDADNDGFGVANSEVCASGPGLRPFYEVIQLDDCDDQDPFRFPGAPEVCDGKPNGCDGTFGEAFCPRDDILTGAGYASSNLFDTSVPKPGSVLASGSLPPSIRLLFLLPIDATSLSLADDLAVTITRQDGTEETLTGDQAFTASWSSSGGHSSCAMSDDTLDLHWLQSGLLAAGDVLRLKVPAGAVSSVAGCPAGAAAVSLAPNVALRFTVADPSAGVAGPPTLAVMPEGLAETPDSLTTFVPPHSQLLHRFSEPMSNVNVSLAPISGQPQPLESDFRAFVGLPEAIDSMNPVEHTGLQRNAFWGLDIGAVYRLEIGSPNPAAPPTLDLSGDALATHVRYFKTSHVSIVTPFGEEFGPMELGDEELVDLAVRVTDDVALIKPSAGLVFNPVSAGGTAQSILRFTAARVLDGTGKLCVEALAADGLTSLGADCVSVHDENADSVRGVVGPEGATARVADLEVDFTNEGYVASDGAASYVLSGSMGVAAEYELSLSADAIAGGAPSIWDDYVVRLPPSVRLRTPVRVTLFGQAVELLRPLPKLGTRSGDGRFFAYTQRFVVPGAIVGYAAHFSPVEAEQEPGVRCEPGYEQRSECCKGQDYIFDPDTPCVCSTGGLVPDTAEVRRVVNCIGAARCCEPCPSGMQGTLSECSENELSEAREATCIECRFSTCRPDGCCAVNDASRSAVLGRPGVIACSCAAPPPPACEPDGSGYCCVLVASSSSAEPECEIAQGKWVNPVPGCEENAIEYNRRVREHEEVHRQIVRESCAKAFSAYNDLGAAQARYCGASLSDAIEKAGRASRGVIDDIFKADNESRHEPHDTNDKLPLVELCSCE